MYVAFTSTLRFLLRDSYNLWNNDVSDLTMIPLSKRPIDLIINRLRARIEATTTWDDLLTASTPSREYKTATPSSKPSPVRVLYLPFRPFRTAFETCTA